MMDSDKLAIAKVVEARQEKFWRISDAIWSYAELGLEEYKSSKLLADTLEAAGFQVERGVAGMPTAFVATWSHGSASPRSGFWENTTLYPCFRRKPGSPKRSRWFRARPATAATTTPCVRPRFKPSLRSKRS